MDSGSREKSTRQHRTVVENARFTKEKSVVERDARRFDEMMESVIWALSTKPEHWDQIGNTEVRALPTEGWPGVPAFVIYYRFTEDQVELLSIRKATKPD
jgi:hypothetical protein